MTPELWQQVKDILEEAAELSAESRPAFLEQACGSDSEMRREVESLLVSHERAGSRFMQTSVGNLLSTLGDDSAFTRVGRRLGGYELLEEIGHGGMGEVYRATRVDGQYKKDVAIKLVRGGYDTKFILERFRHERQILASLDHPNIARLLDGGTTDEGIPYLVMELVEGTPIDQYCDEHRLNVTERLKLFVQVCSPVQYAHQRLVIHRDIKPGNILVTRDGMPKLLDFGIAKILDPSSSVQTTIANPMTPEYASPEQVRGESITTATDVYSLGVVLYQLLTGRSPYRSNTCAAHEFARAICEIEPDRPSSAVLKLHLKVESASGLRSDVSPTPEVLSNLREGAPGKLRRRLAGDPDLIVLKAMRKEPDQRYASVQQFAEDISRHLDGLPITASNASLRYRAGKFVRRHRVGVMAATLGLVAALVGVGVIVREARIAAANEKRAEARFNDVRQLANSLLFDVHDSILDLPGATSARKVLVARALQYLDSLSREVGDDPSLQRELAGAYTRLGDVQGEPRAAALGDSAGALQSYLKALQLREALAQSKSATWEDRLHLGEMHCVVADMKHFSGDLAGTLEHAKKAVEVTSALVGEKGADSTRIAIELSQEYKTLGEAEWSGMAFGSLADPAAALDHYRKAIAIVSAELQRAPGNVRLARIRAVTEMQDARTLVPNGRRQEGVQELRSSLAYVRSLGTSSTSTRSQRNLADALELLGQGLAWDGQLRESLACFREELTTLNRLSKSDAGNLQTQFDMSGAQHDVASSLMRQGKFREAQPFIQRAIATEEQLIAADPKRVEYRTWQGVFRVVEGEVFTGLGNHRKALASFQTAQALFDGVAKGDPLDMDERLSASAADAKIAATLLRLGAVDQARQRYQLAAEASEAATSPERPRQQAQYTLADAYSGLGDIAFRGSANKKADLAEAQSWYEKSLRVWRSIPNPSGISPNGFDTEGPERVEWQLALCRKGAR